MQNLMIGRYDADPEAQGVVKPEDGSWQLVLDKDGYPHLYLRVNIGKGETGMLCLEDMLDSKLSVRELMEGEFSEEPPEDQQEEAHAEYMARKAEHGIPCPRT